MKSKGKKESVPQEYYGPAIRELLMAIDRGNDYKKWVRKELRKKGFVYKAYTAYQDRIRRKRFERELIAEQKLIVQYRKAIKVLGKASSQQ